MTLIVHDLINAHVYFARIREEEKGRHVISRSQASSIRTCLSQKMQHSLQNPILQNNHFDHSLIRRRLRILLVIDHHARAC